jgi:hypothetical protein
MVGSAADSSAGTDSMTRPRNREAGDGGRLVALVSLPETGRRLPGLTSGGRPPSALGARLGGISVAGRNGRVGGMVTPGRASIGRSVRGGCGLGAAGLGDGVGGGVGAGMGVGAGVPGPDAGDDCGPSRAGRPAGGVKGGGSSARDGVENATHATKIANARPDAFRRMEVASPSRLSAVLVAI